MKILVGNGPRGCEQKNLELVSENDSVNVLHYYADVGDVDILILLMIMMMMTMMIIMKMMMMMTNLNQWLGSGCH